LSGVGGEELSFPMRIYVAVRNQGEKKTHISPGGDVGGFEREISTEM
jgi:hypothetical protein